MDISANEIDNLRKTLRKILTNDASNAFISLICRNFLTIHPLDEEAYFHFVINCSRMKERQFYIAEKIRPLIKKYSYFDDQKIEQFINKFEDDLRFANFIRYGCSLQTYFQRKDEHKRFIEEIEQYINP
jgi:hypothetical protein